MTLQNLDVQHPLHSPNVPTPTDSPSESVRRVETRWCGAYPYRGTTVDQVQPTGTSEDEGSPRRSVR